MQIVSSGDNFCMNCQILFYGKNKKIFQNVVCWMFYPESQALNSLYIECMNFSPHINKAMYIMCSNETYNRRGIWIIKEWIENSVVLLVVWFSQSVLFLYFRVGNSSNMTSHHRFSPLDTVLQENGWLLGTYTSWLTAIFLRIRPQTFADFTIIYHIIIGFLINMQVQRQH